jgi:AAA+ superfamily predicted ATPase
VGDDPVTTLDAHSFQTETADTLRSAPPRNDIELILAYVRARLALRVAWLRHLWEDEGPPAGPFGITHAQADAALADADQPEAEDRWLATTPSCAPLLLAVADADLRVDEAYRLSAMATVFGLDPVEVALLQLCVAVAVDPAVARLVAYLHDDVSRPQLRSTLAARLLGTGRSLRLPSDAPVFRWGLVHHTAAPAEPELVWCDRFVRQWLEGDGALDDHLVGLVTIHPPLPPLECWPTTDIASELGSWLDGDDARPARLCIHGPAGAGRRTFAASVAERLGLPLLVVDADATSDLAWADVVRRVHRQAFLDRSAVCWVGESLGEQAWPHDVPPFPLQFVVLPPDRSAPADPWVVDRDLVLPLPDAPARRQLWKEHLPAAATWPADELDRLARRRRSTPGQIAHAATTAPRDATAADDALRAATAPAVGGLVERMERPFEPNDLVVADHVRATLDELVYEAEVRVELWESPSARRLYSAGRGIVGLFSGAPGTGKTMAAQVIARRLHADLLRIDLSTIVSKWVGETSENIDRVLRRVSGSEAVLLFDEADALYGKRATDVSDAQDRYVNIDTGHLMVAIERFDGVVLLATNQKTAIDPAFLRRIRYLVEFPEPDAAQRLEIWRRAMAGLLGGRPTKALDAALATVADSVELTGAQIKSSALSAVLAARRREGAPNLTDLAAGVSRELTKVGRSLSERDVERMVRRGR